MRGVRGILATVGVLALVGAACNNNSAAPSGGGSQGPAMIHQIGPGEGKLNLIAWGGYTQKAWVAPFEQQTGCDVTVKYGNTSDEMVNLMRSQGGTEFDGALNTGFTYQPGAGLDVHVAPRIAIRVEGDYRVIRTTGHNNKESRVLAGAVYAFGTQ